MGLPWFAVASGFSRHPKTLRLCSLLSDHNAGMHVIRLLEHCAEYAPDGLVSADMVERAAGWNRPRSAGKLLSALLEAGFVEASGDLYRIHGWDERNGAHVRKAAKDNAKPNASRRNPDKTPRGVSAGPRAGENSTGEERREQHKAEREPSAAPVPVSSLPRWPNVVETTHPAVWSLWLTLRAKGMDLSIPKSREARDAIEADVRRLGMEAAADECVRVNGDRDDIGNLAFFVDALRKASVPEAPVPGPEPVPMHLLPAVEFEN